MKKEAILHIPMSEYAHGIDEEHYVFRLRTAKGDLRECNLFYGDTACRQTPILFTKEPMKVVAKDALFDYYEVEMKGLYNRIYYYFELWDGAERVYYYSNLFRKELVDDRSEYYKLPYNRREDIAKIPEWVKSAVIYNIFPDSFATGYRYLKNSGDKKEFNGQTTVSRLGGTIKGITANADYLKKLGVNCIYINPLFAAGEYHKYDTLDYRTVDPCFGTNADFKELVETMHASGIRVILDGVFNHCGWHFPAFEDVVEKGEASDYKDWFYRLSFPVERPKDPEAIPNYECFAYERLMPKLNTSNPKVKKYLLETAVYWIKEYGIDGWRLDVASEVNDDFWREFRKVTKAAAPDSFLIGEVWESAGHWLDGSQFDSTMNYDLRKFCMYFFAKEQIDAAAFDGAVSGMRMRYRKNLLYGQLNLFDSHDVPRFLSVCGGRIEVFKLAVLFQMFFVGAPSVFYGDEQGISGVTESAYRTGMQWNENHPLFLFYKQAISVRKSSPAFSEGGYKTLSAKEGARLYGFARCTDREAFSIFLNAGEREAELSADGKELVWSEGFASGKLAGYGFAIFRENAYN